MTNGWFHARTIHFGFAHTVPLESISTSDIRKIEEKIEENGEIKVLGNNIKEDALMEIKCKTDDDSIFTLKFMKVGMVQSGAPEPVYAVVVIIGEKGFHNNLGKIYNLCLVSINDVLDLPKLVINKEATIKTLYGIIKDMPSFQFLWEKILNQPPEKISNFGTPIAGGGLRVVVEPKQIEELDGEVVMAEFKIESFLQDPRYIYTEVKYNWQIPKEYKEFDDLTTSVTKNCDYIFENTKTIVEEFLKEGN